MTHGSDLPASQIAEKEHTAAQLVHQLAQFLRVVRYRKNILFLALAVSGVLGGVYYLTATRMYEARASLLILQTGNDVSSNTSMTPEGATQGLMPTYERLITSAVVLESALKRLSPADRIDLEDAPKDKWIEMLRLNLSVATVRRTNLLDVCYRSKNPKTAVNVVNAVVQAYLEFMEKTHRGTAGEIIAVLTTEKNQLDLKVTEKAAEAIRIRNKFGNLSLAGQDQKTLHPIVQRAVKLNDALIEAQQKRLQYQASLAAIQGSVQRGEDLQQHLLAVQDAAGRDLILTGLGFSKSNMQTELEKSLLEYRSELKTLSEFYGPNNPLVMEVQDKIRTTEQYLLSYQDKVNQQLAQIRDKQLGPLLVQMVSQRLNEAWQHEQSLRNNYEQAKAEAVGLNGQMAELEIVEHDLHWLRSLREALLNQIASVDLRQDAGDIRTAVVSEPVISNKPVSPRKSPVLLLCVFAATAIGLTVIFVLDSLDDRFRSPDELRLQLGIPVLAMIRRLEQFEAIGIDSLQVHVAPEDVQSEAFRTLRTTLAFSGRDSQRIVVSSAEPGDGKTTVLANLAVTFAQSGKKTLLIDADMRRPGLTSLLGMRSMGGLSEVLRDDSEISKSAERHLQRSGVEGLDVLPCGPRPSNPAELLAGTRFSDLLAWAETIYDQILVDGPPALAASDSAIIGRLVDGVVLVVRPDKNQRRLVVRAVESFSSLNVTMLGVVINRASNEKDEGYYGEGYGVGYGYGYGKGYGGYGADADEEAIAGAVGEGAASPAYDDELDEALPRRAA